MLYKILIGTGVTLLVVAVIIRSQIAVPIFIPTQTCPTISLSPEEVTRTAKEGIKIIDDIDEHISTEALERALPLLKQAALHGSVNAQEKYSGLLIYLGIVEMVGLPNGTPQPLVAQEGMMFHILATHRGVAHPEGEEEVYDILLNPHAPYPDGFFRQSSGTGWYLQMLPSWSLNTARTQAHNWKNCWN